MEGLGTRGVIAQLFQPTTQFAFDALWTYSPRLTAMTLSADAEYVEQVETDGLEIIDHKMWNKILLIL